MNPLHQSTELSDHPQISSITPASSTQQPAAKTRAWKLLILVCLMLFSLLLGCSSSVGNDSDAGDNKATEPASRAVTETETPVPPTSTPAAAAEREDSMITVPEESPPGPEIGEITFALDATEDFEPIDPSFLFTKGITEVHAIFEYEEMSPDYTWERVWYLNEKEVSRSSSTWTGDENGVFDYFIDNGGRPLPAGDWILELYVEDELQSLGVFIIEADETAEAAEKDVYQLAYTKCDGRHHNIYVADTNGHNQQLIVSRGGGPSWTPDGSLIFFYGEEGVDHQARDGLEYVFDGISNGLVAVRTSPLPTSLNQLSLFQGLEWKQGSARWANISPDGSMVAYDAKPSGDYRIYFLGTETNQQFRYEILGEQADWSPDSQRIVYRSGRDGKTGLWISKRDDSGHVLITNNGSDSFPAWSPDGQTIAFSRDEGGNVDIYTVNVDGSNLQRLTTRPGHDTLPTYAPNGDIIFRSARSGGWGIWKMAGDGTNQTQIIADACVGNDWALSRMDVLN